MTGEAGVKGTDEIKKGSGVRRKLQLSLAPELTGKSLSIAQALPGMHFQAKVEAKEDKGFICDLGFKDGTKAFVKDAKLRVKQLI